MEGYITIQELMDNITEHPLLADVSLERVIKYTELLMKIIGSPKLFTDKVAIIDINNYRGTLPCDFIDVIQVRGINGEEYVGDTNSFMKSNNKTLLFLKQCCGEFYVSGFLTYKIQGNVIFTSLKNGKIEIAYKALMLDENGYPVLPDNAKFLRALEAYVKKKQFIILFDLNKISNQVLQQALQDYAFYIGQALNSFVMPTLDEMLTITNMWNTLIPRVNEHRNGFATLGMLEKIRRH